MSIVVRFHHPGPPSVLVLEDEDVPLPGPGEVRFRARAIGVNFVDTAFRDGSFNSPLPAAGGVEAAGVIDAVGPGVTDHAVGDRVGYFFAPGSYAELRNVPAEVLIRLPDDIAFDDAAAIMTKGLTAWVAIRHLHPVEPGEAVLVQGATRGVGSLTARWADALGAHVVGTGSPSKLGALTGSGVRGVDSHDPNLADQLRRLVPGGFDVVCEFVGRATFPASVAAMRDGGEIVMIGAASGRLEVDRDTLASRRIRLSSGSTAQLVRGSLLASASAEVFDAHRQGVFGTLRLSRYPLADAVRAHEDIASRNRDGLLLLIP
jgi:NADPH2:quinone reductase